MTEAGRLQVCEERFQETAPRLAPRCHTATSDANPRVDEWSDEARHTVPLMVDRIACGGITFVPPGVSGFVRRKRSKAEPD